MPRPSSKRPERRRRTRPVWIWPTLVGVVVLLGLVTWFWWSGRISRGTEPKEPVRIAPVPVPEEPLLPPVTNPVVVVPEPLKPVVEEPVTPPVKPQPQPPPVVETPPSTNAPVLPTARVPAADLTTIPQRPPTNILEAQIALTAYGIGSGSLDGVGGYQTAWALKAFQYSRGMEETGRLDRDTLRELKFLRPLYREIIVTAEDLAGLAPVPSGWLEKSARKQLGYESALELVAERSHANPSLVRRLNPGVQWQAMSPGTTVVVPNAEYPPARKAALVRVSLANRYLRAFDSRGGLLAHFPCSIGRIAEKRPVGELKAAVVVKDPNYTFDPAVFAESPEARKIGRKLIIPPGPNNPVGVAWIGLSRAGYGIHGTPGPEQVGRTESHGCFRLANWNADYLRRMMAVGTPVWIEP